MPEPHPDSSVLHCHHDTVTAAASQVDPGKGGGYRWDSTTFENYMNTKRPEISGGQKGGQYRLRRAGKGGDGWTPGHYRPR